MVNDAAPDAPRGSHRARHRRRAPGGPDPLFGPGLRITHEQHGRGSGGGDKAGGGLATLRRMPELITLTVRLGWQADRVALLTVAAGQLLVAVATSVSYLQTQKLLTGIFASGSSHDRLAAIRPVLAVMVGALMVRGACSAITTAASGRLGPRIARAANLTFLERAVHVELAAIEDASFHNLLASARRGADATQRVTERTVGLTGALMSIIAALSVLFTLNPLFVPLLFLTLVPQAWGVARTVGARHASVNRWIERIRQLDHLAMLMTSPESAEEIRVHRLGDFLLRHYRRLSGESEHEQARLARGEARTHLVAGSVAGLGATFTYGLLVIFMVSGSMPVAVAGTAAFAIRSSSITLASLVMQTQMIYQDGLYVLDWKKACAEAEKVAIPTTGSYLPASPSSIAAHGLSFTYPNTRAPALNGVDVCIRRGEVVALVGENGSGKSTLAKLLTGLYLPSDGLVLWDGVPTAQIDRNRVYDQIALISQNFVQWPFTARMNVAVGRPERAVDEVRLRQAVTATGADAVITRLEKGWGALLAREFWGGTNLSAGQWQRLGLARAWYRDSPVLVVDEPTSALDPSAEIEIFNRIVEQARDGRTVILITHRLASVARADHIYVLAEGVVIQHGTHDELMRTGGAYADMYRLQAAQYETAE
jgi:ATP-binding cassette subfamily B protein